MGKQARLKKLRRALASAASGAKKAEDLLIERHKELFPGEKTVILREPAGFEKMSEVLEEFAAPWLEEANGVEEIHTIISLAALAWNLSLMPQEERFKSLSDSTDFQISAQMRLLLEEFITRKELYFPANNRFIADFEMAPNENGTFRLEVMSLIDPSKAQNLNALIPPGTNF